MMTYPRRVIRKCVCDVLETRLNKLRLLYAEYRRRVSYTDVNCRRILRKTSLQKDTYIDAFNFEKPYLHSLCLSDPGQRDCSQA